MKHFISQNRFIPETQVPFQVKPEDIIGGPDNVDMKHHYVKIDSEAEELFRSPDFSRQQLSVRRKISPQKNRGPSDKYRFEACRSETIMSSLTNLVGPRTESFCC